MNPIVPELSPERTSPVRIPGELDVPLTARVRSLLDSSPMQRLRRVSQLGLVANVYPGATHTRFEHSLGVYRLGCQVLSHLLSVESEFAMEVEPQDACIFLLSTLLHDVGHWPYCHPIEDLHFDDIPEHEQIAQRLICEGELADKIRGHWNLDPRDVADFIAGKPQPNRARQVLRNVMDGPVDVDKMDYLQRDSLHAGVPYGRNFDVGRLISSMRLGQDGSSLAITEKGKTAAEMLVFARYVMFSEVYWHHTVRSATAMLQRLVFELRPHLRPQAWIDQSDAEFQTEILSIANQHPPIERLARNLFGGSRRLYKRFSQYSFGEENGVHDLLAGKPYPILIEVARQVAERLSHESSAVVHPIEVLIDAAPVQREVQFRVPVWISGEVGRRPSLVPLADISPVVNALATEQFDHYVKRVRVFLAADSVAKVQAKPEQLSEWIRDILGTLVSENP